MKSEFEIFKLAQRFAVELFKLGTTDGTQFGNIDKLLSGSLNYLTETGPDIYLNRHIRKHGRASDSSKILDFGCGNGPHKNILEKYYNWVGCDYEGTNDPASLRRFGNPLDEKIIKYDGKYLTTIKNEEFAAVWSWQSFEHVTHPEISVSEVSRILKKSGYFLGSVSYLEPYHAESTYGYSPYGWKIILERHGLKLIDCVPGIDGIALMIKHLCGALRVPHDEAKLWDLMKYQDIFHTHINDLDDKSKAEFFIRFCGHFRFTAIKL